MSGAAQAYTASSHRLRGGRVGKRPAFGAYTASCIPPTSSFPVTCASTVYPCPSGMATNCRITPAPALIPSSHGWCGTTR